MYLMSVRLRKDHRFKHYARFETREQAIKFGEQLKAQKKIFEYRLKEVK
jgi:hypothetical protein